MNFLAIPVHVQASVLDTLHRLSKLIVAASIQFSETFWIPGKTAEQGLKVCALTYIDLCNFYSTVVYYLWCVWHCASYFGYRNKMVMYPTLKELKGQQEIQTNK